jgi:predicted KAP-like P-loop ATPase
MHGQGFSSGDHHQGKKHFTLNVTAEWGAGKTFFLKGLLHDLKKLGHPVVYFDAWKNDLSNDPIASFIAHISDGLLGQLPPRSKYKSGLKKSAISLLKATAKVVASAAVKKLLGMP